MRNGRSGTAWSALLAVGLSLSASSLASDPRETALAQLHDGRFDAADRTLEEAARGDPSPANLFFRAFTTYWRLLYDEDDTALQRELERRLLRAIEHSAASASSGRDDGEAALWEGSARLLLAELRAHQKHLFAAAFEARRARRALETARERGGAGVEPLFGLGLYDYVADQVPSFVKGLRALLFLPGGDRDRGLERLHRAASGSRYFALESRLLLVTIYSSDEERLYEEARRQAETAAESDPPTLAGLLASGRIELDLGEADRAIRRLDAALARADGAADTDAAVLGELLLQRARADFARFRPDLARSRIVGRMLPMADRVPEETREDAEQLREACDALLAPAGRSSGDPASWSDLREALEAERTGGVATSVGALRALAERHPADASVALLLGRSLLLGGDGSGALPFLERAAAAPGLPTAWRGPALLLAGRAADLTGQRALALTHYRAAAGGPSFIGKDAAVHHQRIAYEGMESRSVREPRPTDPRD